VLPEQESELMLVLTCCSRGPWSAEYRRDGVRAWMEEWGEHVWYGTRWYSYLPSEFVANGERGKKMRAFLGIVSNYKSKTSLCIAVGYRPVCVSQLWNHRVGASGRIFELRYTWCVEGLSG